MVTLANVDFDLPDGWAALSAGTGYTVQPPTSGPPVAIEVRIARFPVATAKSIRLLETVQATVASVYPAFTVNSLLERPLARGTCVEVELKPRSGSALHPAQAFALLLPRHLVLVDYRRPETAAHLDPVVRRFVHCARELAVSDKVAGEFAALRRGETKLVRRALGQWQAFLCHNSKDKDRVRELRDRLFDAGICCWFDENEIAPGQRFVSSLEEGLAHVDAILVARGAHGLGDWQQLEYGAALNEYVRRQRSGARQLKIIPIALPGAPPLSEWTGFLGTFHGVEFGTKLTTNRVRDLVRQIVPGRPIGADSRR
ncbi:MAG: toll/interleukin-1 receptor domain-containing protein [Planctomycetes bacterium]|jgi:hypothetical protein|nr:toll/interleukin-1 receptor domain-containing protein [Planctomycetota bacterium]